MSTALAVFGGDDVKRHGRHRRFWRVGPALNAADAYISAMISINSCTKCGAVVCACGFAATLFVSVFGSGKPPPRAVGPIAAQLTAVTTLSAVSTSLISGSSSAFLTVHDQINGKVYSAVWL